MKTNNHKEWKHACRIFHLTGIINIKQDENFSNKGDDIAELSGGGV